MFTPEGWDSEFLRKSMGADIKPLTWAAGRAFVAAATDLGKAAIDIVQDFERRMIALDLATKAVDSVVPDDDLGAWLAASVMGMRSVGCNWHTGMPICGRKYIAKHLWNPLRNGEQALMVKRRMFELGWDWCEITERSNGDADVRFHRKGLPDGRFIDKSWTEALCHASKAAIEAERAAKTTTCGYCGSVVE